MTGRMTLALLAGVVVAVAVGTVVLLVRGTGGAAVAGTAWGFGLGAAGSILEGVMVTRALRRPKGRGALGIFMGGFGIRLVTLMGVALWFHRSGTADPIAFALCYLGGFLAGLPVLAAAIAPRRSGAAPAPETRP
jgi:hypothetical protein